MQLAVATLLDLCYNAHKRIVDRLAVCGTCKYARLTFGILPVDVCAVRRSLTAHVAADHIQAIATTNIATTIASMWKNGKRATNNWHHLKI